MRTLKNTAGSKYEMYKISRDTIKMKCIKLVGILLSLTLVSFSSLVFAGDISHNALIIDAGSTGSRLYNYHYHQNSQTKLPVIDNESDTKLSGGIKDVADQDLDAYLTELFTSDDNSVPETIKFYSTAGMRIISATRREKINARVRQWISSNYPQASVSVKTINGQAEGAYTWLAINYLNGSLADKSMNYGILELGGASTQIVYDSNIDDSNSITVTAGDTKYHLVAVSFLGLGQDQAMTQYLNQSACFPKGYLLPNGKVGQGDFKQCSKAITPLIEQVHHVSHAVGSSSSGVPFISIAGFYYTADELHLTNDYSLSALKSAGTQFCNYDWDTLEDGGSDYNVNDHLYTYCFNSAYQYSLMKDGYLFNDHTNMITPINKIDNKRISWTLGALVSDDPL